MTLKDILTVCKPSQGINLIFDDNSDVWCAADTLTEICLNKVLSRSVSCIETQDEHIVIRIKGANPVPKEPLRLIREAEALTKHGNNAAIVVYDFPEEKMRELGFTDYQNGWWYFHKAISADISFNLQIAKDGSDWQIDVLDENFCQPYDYQHFIMKSEINDIPFVALKTKEKVDQIMEDLVEKGVIRNWKVGDYI